MEIIQRNDPFFQTDLFLKNKALYCGMAKMLESPLAIIRADQERKIIFAQKDESAPIWIWTEEVTDQSICDYAAKLFYANYVHQDTIQIISRPEVGGYVATYFSKMKNLSWNTGMKFEAFKINTEYSEERKHRIIKLDYIDEMLLTDVVQGVPSENRSQIFKRLYSNKEEMTIDIDQLYVFMREGEIRGTISIDMTLSEYGKISDIFLLKALRGHDIGKSIMLEASEIVMKKGLMPLLFTERASRYTRLLQNDERFIPIGSLDEIIIYK